MAATSFCRMALIMLNGICGKSCGFLVQERRKKIRVVIGCAINYDTKIIKNVSVRD